MFNNNRHRGGLLTLNQPSSNVLVTLAIGVVSLFSLFSWLFMDHLLSHHELFLEHTVLCPMAECCMLPVVQLHRNWKQCVHHISLWSRQLVTCGHSRLQVLRWAAKVFTTRSYINQRYSSLLLVVTRKLKKVYVRFRLVLWYLVTPLLQMVSSVYVALVLMCRPFISCLQASL